MERVPVYVTTSLKGEVSLKDEAKLSVKQAAFCL